MLKLIALFLVVLTLIACSGPVTNVSGPSCSAGATSTVGGAGNADGVEAGANADAKSGCDGGSIAQE